VERPAYILGLENQTINVNLSQSVVMNCLAGGYPTPFVTWWRGDRILPPKSDNFEIRRDYSLVFTHFSDDNLGDYSCQAYNAIGRPVNMLRTLKIFKESSSTNTEEIGIGKNLI